MNKISTPPIKARHYVKKPSSSTIPSGSLYIEESTQDLLDFTKPNTSFSTFNGFFEEIPTKPSLIYEIYKSYAKDFLQTSQYLWGIASSASLLKAIQEIQENIENYTDNSKEQYKKILVQAAAALLKELELRENIQHKMLIGSLMPIVE
ncbi:MAG: hypothetical protein ABW007_27085 [Chitinophagaceae bacterium]